MAVCFSVKNDFIIWGRFFAHFTTFWHLHLSKNPFSTPVLPFLGVAVYFSLSKHAHFGDFFPIFHVFLRFKTVILAGFVLYIYHTLTRHRCSLNVLTCGQ